MKVLGLIVGNEAFIAPAEGADLEQLFVIIRTWAQKAKAGASAELMLKEVSEAEWNELQDFQFPAAEDVKS